MCMVVFLHACLHTTSVPGTLGIQKRTLDYLRLELQAVVNSNSQLGAGD